MRLRCVRPECLIPVALIFLFVCAPAWSQEPVGISVSEIRTAFEETVEVELVNVEIRVEDHKGRPIRGLAKEDFQVFEDRRPVDILHFSELSDHSGSVVPDSSKSADTAGSVKPEAEAANSVSEPGVLVLYFDNSHLRSGGRKRLVRDLKDLIRSGALPSPRVLVLAQDPGLETLAPVGSNAEDLLRALEQVETGPAGGHEIDRDRTQLMDRLHELAQMSTELFGNPCTMMRDEGLRNAESFGRQVAARVGVTLRHLAGLSSSLIGIPGPKSVLYFGAGLELLPMGDVTHYLSEVCPQFAADFRRQERFLDQTTRFQRLTRHANANRVTFYPMDAQGLSVGSSASVDHATFDWKPSPLNDQIRRANLQNSLSFMASDTGGRAVFNRNSLHDEILAVHREAGSFYSVAYRPLHEGDGKTHTIDVEVRRKKARVRHRLSYRDKSSDERMADRLQGALRLGLESDPMGIDLTRGPARATDKDGIFEVPVRVTVPLEALVFLPEDEHHVGRLRLQVAARDASGRDSAFHQKLFEVELDPSLAGRASGRHTFMVDLMLRSGPHVLAVALRDELSRETSYRASKVTVVSPTKTP